MIVIDGGFGEGGGQILRTAVALSALKGIPVKIENIRANRPNPGLQAQHLTCVKAVGELCSAKVSGLKLGSREITFNPGEVKAKKLVFDVGTAGSITLVLQALLPPALNSKEPMEISIKGGTDVQWSPPIDYARFVLTSMLKRFGYDFELKMLRRGYYPAGGGLVGVYIKPALRTSKITLLERGDIKQIKGISHAHKSLEERDVAGRQGKSARLNLFNDLSNKKIDCEIKIVEEYCEAYSVGSGLTLWAEFSNTTLGGSALGGKTKRAEEVGLEAAGDLISQLSSNTQLDVHMVDQIIPYLALLGGEVKIPSLSNHARTNIHVVNQFGFEVKVEGGILKS